MFLGKTVYLSPNLKRKATIYSNDTQFDGEATQNFDGMLVNGKHSPKKPQEDIKKHLARSETVKVSDTVNNNEINVTPISKGKTIIVNNNSPLEQNSMDFATQNFEDNSFMFTNEKSKPSSKKPFLLDSTQSLEGIQFLGKQQNLEDSFDFNNQESTGSAIFSQKNTSYLNDQKKYEEEVTLPSDRISLLRQKTQCIQLGKDEEKEEEQEEREEEQETTPQKEEKINTPILQKNEEKNFKDPKARRFRFSKEFQFTKKFPPDKIVCLDEQESLSDSDTDLPLLNREDTAPLAPSFFKMSCLKSISTEYSDIWVMYNEMAVSSFEEAVDSKCIQFGRSDDCHSNCKFDFDKISSKHCKLFVIKKEGNGDYPEFQVWVEDTSSNGTYINKELIGKNNKKILCLDDTLSIYIPKNSEKHKEISYVLKEIIVDDKHNHIFFRANTSSDNNSFSGQLRRNSKTPPSDSLNSMVDNNEGNIQNKPVCIYGKGCYRVNPEHKKNYYHPN